MGHPDRPCGPGACTGSGRPPRLRPGCPGRMCRLHAYVRLRSEFQGPQCSPKRARVPGTGAYKGAKGERLGLRYSVRTYSVLTLPSRFSMVVFPGRRLVAAPLLFAAAILSNFCAGNGARRSSLDFVPSHVFSSTEWALISATTASIAEHAMCTVPYSRHGGAHRSADRPMGSTLVRPLHERRVPIADGFRLHLEASSLLP